MSDEGIEPEVLVTGDEPDHDDDGDHGHGQDEGDLEDLGGDVHDGSPTCAMGC